MKDSHSHWCEKSGSPERHAPHADERGIECDLDETTDEDKDKEIYGSYNFHSRGYRQFAIYTTATSRQRQ